MQSGTFLGVACSCCHYVVSEGVQIRAKSSGCEIREFMLQDLRTLNSSRVYIENNAGFQGALAAMVEAPGTWEQCLQGYGVLTQDHTVCSKL